jgi:hypothetical protein
MKHMEKIKDYFQGKYSKRSLTRLYLPLAVSLYALFIIMARLLFPYIEDYPYSWTTSMISRLGWPHVNTIGWIFFSLAYLSLGIFYLALISYMYKRFSALHKFAAKLIALSMLMSSIGMIMVGAIPNYPPNIFGLFHMLSAMLSMFGLYGMALFSAIIMIKESSLFSKNLLLFFVIIMAYIFICAVIMSFGNPSTEERYYVHNPSTPLLLSRPLWEWQIMIASICLISILCFIVPASIEKQNEI